MCDHKCERALSLEKKIEDLQEEVFLAKAQRDSYRYTYSERSPAAASCVDQLINCQGAREKLESDIENMSRSLKAMRYDLSEAREERDRLLKALDAEREENGWLRKKLVIHGIMLEYEPESGELQINNGKEPENE